MPISLFLKIHEYARYVAVAGFFVYLASLYFVDSSQNKTIFYILCALPGLFLLPRFTVLLNQFRWALLSVFAFLGYFSLSALWSGQDDAVADAAKFSLYVLCLLLCIEAVMRSVLRAPERIVYFFVILGGVSALFYFSVLAFRGADFSSLIVGRSSLNRLSGWGEDNPISSAVYFGVPVLAAWWILPGSSWRTKAALGCVIVLCVTLMLITKSRGPMMSLLISLAIISLCRRHREDLYLWGVVLLFALCIFIFTDIWSILYARLGQPNYRSEIWMHSLLLIQDNLWIGQGFDHPADIPMGNGLTVTHSHSSVLEVLRVGGIVGGSLFVAMLLLCLGRVFSKGSAGWFFLSWLLFGLLCLSTNGRLPLEKPAIEWFCFWIPLFFTLFCPNTNLVKKSEVAIGKS